MRRPDAPTAWFLHLLDPHLPMRHLADGRLIEGRTRPLDLDGDWVSWGSEQAVVDQSRVRYLVQLQNVDRRVGEVMDRLESEGMADDTMLVITSDHGIAFEADDHRRAVPPNAVNENQVVPVPLFVRYPGQTVGAIDDRPASVLDIVPTVADALDIDLGADWAVDGESLLGPEQGTPRAFRWGKGDKVMDVAEHLDPESAAAAYADLVGPPGGAHDLYAWGPWRTLVGRPVTDVAAGNAEPVAATITAPAGTPTYDPSSGVVPALIEGKLATTPPEGWVAVSVNGTIAGVGPVAVADDSRFSVLVDPALLRPGANDVDVWLVGADGRLRSVTSA